MQIFSVEFSSSADKFIGKCDKLLAERYEKNIIFISDIDKRPRAYD
jgi:hypothetical protein